MACGRVGQQPIPNFHCTVLTLNCESVGRGCCASVDKLVEITGHDHSLSCVYLPSLETLP